MKLGSVKNKIKRRSITVNSSSSNNNNSITIINVIQIVVLSSVLILILALILYHSSSDNISLFTIDTSIHNAHTITNANANANDNTNADSINSICKVSFVSSCQIKHQIKYWNDHDLDCMISPISDSSSTKYIVFQPDLGGWNNIRMALEVVIVFALASGRTLVIPPPAVLYLLHMNKKWKDNFHDVTDFIDFSRLTAKGTIRTISMENFLNRTLKNPSILSLPLPGNNIKLAKEELWTYLEKASWLRQWSPGKIIIGFNTSTDKVCGGFDNVDKNRLKLTGIGRELVPYNDTFHQHDVIYFPGHDKNRLLTHFYGFMFFAEPNYERKIKSFVRDRVRYHDTVYCLADKIIGSLLSIEPNYIAYHIRRGDFAHKNTRLEPEEIIRLTSHLIKDSSKKLVYIATDDTNSTFFAPFYRIFESVRFISHFSNDINIDNQNHIGMIEQIICANAHTFIGTPLSTYTSYITRLRGYMNITTRGKGYYNRTYYFMDKQMYQLHTKPRLTLPFWPREFVDAFDVLDPVNE